MIQGCNGCSCGSNSGAGAGGKTGTEGGRPADGSKTKPNKIEQPPAVAVSEGSAAGERKATGEAINTSQTKEAGTVVVVVGDKKQPDPATLGELKGIVKFEGPVPPRVKIPLTAECRNGAIAEIEREDVIVNKNGTLMNVFVYIKNGDALAGLSFPAPDAPVVLDQKGCQYVPHVFGIQTGQQLQIKNSDNATHNVHSMGKKNQPINTAQPANSPPILVKLKVAETKYTLKCDMHPWMSAFANIVPHPFFSVTNDSGEFTMKNVPPGKYTVEAVHEIYGAKTVEVEVAPKGSASAEFIYK